MEHGARPSPSPAASAPPRSEPGLSEPRAPGVTAWLGNLTPHGAHPRGMAHPCGDWPGPAGIPVGPFTSWAFGCNPRLPCTRLCSPRFQFLGVCGRARWPGRAVVRGGGAMSFPASGVWRSGIPVSPPTLLFVFVCS